MIRIERGEEIDGPGSNAGRRHGVYRYSCPEISAVQGYSRQPLLDACRQLKPILGDTFEQTQLFREGCSEPDISCSINAGAGLTVEDSVNGVTFRKYRAMGSTLRDNRQWPVVPSSSAYS
jgi:hypothetical protein